MIDCPIYMSALHTLDKWGRSHPTVGAATPIYVAPGAIQQAKKALASTSGSSVPLWHLTAPT